MDPVGKTDGTLSRLGIVTHQKHVISPGDVRGYNSANPWNVQNAGPKESKMDWVRHREVPWHHDNIEGP